MAITHVYDSITASDVFGGYLTLTERVSDAVTYIGKAKRDSATSDPVWQVQRIVQQGNTTRTEYFGQGAFEYIWDDRVSLAWPALVPPPSAYTNSYSLKFDGNNDWVNCGTGSTTNPGTGDFSLTAWVKTDVYTGQRVIISRQDNPTVIKGYSLELYLGAPHVEIGSGTVRLAYNSPVVLQPNIWYFIGGTFDRDGSVHIYVNGVSTVSYSIASLAAADLTMTEPFVMGARKQGATIDFVHSGLIDEPAYWSKALSAAEMLSLYNFGKPNDLTGKSGIVSNWRNGDNTSYPSIPDVIGANDGVMTSMLPIDIVPDVP